MITKHLDRFYDNYEGLKVSKTLFSQRIVRAEKRGKLDERVKVDARSLSIERYKRKYSSRQTVCYINGIEVNLRIAYKEILNPRIGYKVFRARLKSFSEKQLRLKLANYENVLEIAANYSQSDWMAFIGTGRSRHFIYTGILYLRLQGQNFPSFSHFMKVIGQSDKLSLVQGRIKQGWDLDSAIYVPKMVPKDGLGRIYKITSNQTPKIYIGITTLSIEERFSQHKAESQYGGSRQICQAMRALGSENFEIEELDVIDNIGFERQLELLKQRESDYIKLYNSLHPNGFNSTNGGELTVRGGNETPHNNVIYPSLSAAARAVTVETNGDVPPYCAAVLLKAGKNIPERTRKHSKHPDAGTNLFRRHLKLKRSQSLALVWDDYDVYKRDVLKDKALDEIISRQLILWPVDKASKYGPDNFRWVTKKTAIELRCGKRHTVFGKRYSSMEAISRKFDIPVSNLKYWMKLYDLDAENAVKTGLDRRRNK